MLSAKPLLIDEIISLFQARIFASGQLWLPAPRYPEFTSAMHLLDWNGKVYGQFPAGGPAMLAIGVLLHAAWLVGPVATAIGVYLFARLLRRIELRDGTALAALLLYALGAVHGLSRRLDDEPRHRDDVAARARRWRCVHRRRPG